MGIAIARCAARLRREGIAIAWSAAGVRRLFEFSQGWP
jgi:hypothetical protein